MTDPILFYHLCTYRTNGKKRKTVAVQTHRKCQPKTHESNNVILLRDSRYVSSWVLKPRKHTLGFTKQNKFSTINNNNLLCVFRIILMFIISSNIYKPSIHPTFIKRTG